jgi:hypothetical protein
VQETADGPAKTERHTARRTRVCEGAGANVSVGGTVRAPTHFPGSNWTHESFSCNIPFSSSRHYFTTKRNNGDSSNVVPWFLLPTDLPATVIRGFDKGYSIGGGVSVGEMPLKCVFLGLWTEQACMWTCSTVNVVSLCVCVCVCVFITCQF